MTRAVIDATRGWPIPVAGAFVGGARVAPGARAFEETGIPCYPFPEPAVRTLAGMARLAERRRRRAEPARLPVRVEETKAAVARLRASGRSTLGMTELEAVLESYGIPCATARPAATPAEAASVAERLGFPVALKLRSPDITHKTEVGGVRLGLGSACSANSGWRPCSRASGGSRRPTSRSSR